MSQALSTPTSTDSLTGLVVPLTDRNLLLPNVALAELIAYRGVQVNEAGPDWFVGQVAWRDLRLPLLSFEAASGATLQPSSSARIAVLNALGGREQVKFIALLVQGIPRSLKVGPELARAAAPLLPLELAAVQHADGVLKIPDLLGLEQMLADAGLI